MKANAGKLSEAHIGKHIRYGPSLMFGGQLEVVEPSKRIWLGLKGSNDDHLTEIPTPERVHIKTTDGRWASLDCFEEIEIGDC